MLGFFKRQKLHRILSEIDASRQAHEEKRLPDFKRTQEDDLLRWAWYDVTPLDRVVRHVP